MCNYKQADDVVKSTKILLRRIANLIVEGESGVKPFDEIGENVVLLRDVMAALKFTDFKEVARDIKKLPNMERATDQEKILRLVQNAQH